MASQKGRKGKAAKKAYYERYKSLAPKKRKERQERHAKRHPNDKQGGSTTYRKKTPQNESGWLTNAMDYKLTPVQLTPVKDKDSGKLTQPECAQSLREMKNKDRKKFAQLYARVRKIHAMPKQKEKKDDKKKGGQYK